MNVVNGQRISRNRDRQGPTRDIIRIFVPPVGWPYVGGTMLPVKGKMNRSSSGPLRYRWLRLGLEAGDRRAKIRW